MRFRSFVVCCTVWYALFFCQSCVFNWDNMVSSPYPVSQRSTLLKEINPASLSFSSGSPGTYTVAVLTDTHISAFGDPPGTQKLLDWIHSQPLQRRPVFCAVLGDLVFEGGEEAYGWFNDFAAKLREPVASGGGGMQVFPVLGNHDVGTAGQGGKWFTRLVYPNSSFYRIKTANTSFYFLDTGDGTLGKSQLNDLLANLSADKNMKFTFTHFPFYETILPTDRMLNMAERAKLIDAYAKNNVKVAFCGHVHERRDISFGKFTQCVVPNFFGDKPAFVLLTIDEDALAYSYEYVFLPD